MTSWKGAEFQVLPVSVHGNLSPLPPLKNVQTLYSIFVSHFESSVESTDEFEL